MYWYRNYLFNNVFFICVEIFVKYTFFIVVHKRSSFFTDRKSCKIKMEQKVKWKYSEILLINASFRSTFLKNWRKLRTFGFILVWRNSFCWLQDPHWITYEAKSPVSENNFAGRAFFIIYFLPCSITASVSDINYFLHAKHPSWRILLLFIWRPKSETGLTRQLRRYLHPWLGRGSQQMPCMVCALSWH